MNTMSGNLIENNKLVRLTVAIGRAEIKLRKDYPEVAKELVDALISATSKPQMITIFQHSTEDTDVK